MDSGFWSQEHAAQKYGDDIQPLFLRRAGQIEILKAGEKTGRASPLKRIQIAAAERPVPERLEQQPGRIDIADQRIVKLDGDAFIWRTGMDDRLVNLRAVCDNDITGGELVHSALYNVVHIAGNEIKQLQLIVRVQVKTNGFRILVAGACSAEVRR